MKVHIQKFGEGFPLVFFHGWGFDSQVWFSLVPKLKLYYQVILVDLPGFGNTPIMDWQLFKMNTLPQLPNLFALIGWSMGGLYALRLTSEHPDKVSYLINVCSSPKFLLDELWPGVSRDVFGNFHQRLSTNFMATITEFIELNGLKIDKQLIYLPEKTPSSESLEFGLKVIELWDLREQLKQYTRPMSFMFGRLDPIVPIKTMQFMQINYPEFHYVLFKRAAHMPFLSHTDLFISEIQGLIK